MSFPSAIVRSRLSIQRDAAALAEPESEAKLRAEITKQLNDDANWKKGYLHAFVKYNPSVIREETLRQIQRDLDAADYLVNDNEDPYELWISYEVPE